MQATQPIRTVTAPKAGLAALAAAAVLASAVAIGALVAPSLAGVGSTSGSSGGAIFEVHRAVQEGGGSAPLVMDPDAAKGAGQRGGHVNIGQ
jgi:hypothetical protein